MNKYKLIFAVTIIALLAGSDSSFFQSQKSIPKVILPSEVKFVVNPNDPSALQTAILDGDPSKPELYTMRVKIPANVKLLAHWHPETREVIVVTGTFYFGYGNQFDENKLSRGPKGCRTPQSQFLNHVIIYGGAEHTRTYSKFLQLYFRKKPTINIDGFKTEFDQCIVLDQPFDLFS